MTYYIVPTPPQTADKNIYTAPNGAEGFAKDNQLHLTDGKLHYIYKFADQMWFMRNDKTGVDYPLGEGASPTINVYDISVKAEAKTYWQSIIYTPETNEEGDEE